jgi:hypothetical protein
MHDLDATRIFWKEWRAQRSFWLGLLALAIGLEVLLIFVAPLWRPTSLLEQLRYHEGLAAVLACAFATGSAAIAFAGEVEAKTKGLLQRVPVRARDLLAGKLTFSLAGSYSLFLALWLFGGLLLSESRSLTVSRAIQAQMAEGALKPELEAELRAKAAAEAPMFDVAWLQENLRGPLAFVVVGSLVSLLLSDVLLTVLIAGVVTSVLVAIPVVRDSLLLQGTVLAAALVCDFLLARRWLVQTRAVEWGWLPRLSFPRLEFGRRHAIADHSTTLESVRSPVAWRRAAGSLIWKEFRQAYLFCLAILIVGLVTIALVPFVESSYWGKGSATLLPWVLALAPLLPGVAAMRAERKGRAYQLLANQGIAADGFLACKHFVWLTLSLAVFGILLLVDGVYLADLSHNAPPFRTLWQSALEVAGESFGLTSPGPTAALVVAGVHITLLYALGFLLALLLPGPIIAVFAGVLIELAVVLGWIVVAQLEIPFWWTVGLFPLILLAVAWVRTSDWLVGRGRSAWWKVAATFFVPISAIAATTAAYRVLQIPAVVIPQAVLESQDRSGTMQRAPAQPSLFVKAMQAMTGAPPAYFATNEVVRDNGWQLATPAEREWIEKNSRARQLALDAVQQPPGSFPPPLAGGARERAAALPFLQKMRLLADLLFYSARKFEFEDRLAEALACYVAAARLGSDAAKADQAMPGMNGNWLTLRALEAMQRWAAAPKQTTALVQQAIREFSAFEPTPATPSISILRDWQIDRRDLHATVWGYSPTPSLDHAVAQLWWVRWFLPWELLRLERLTDAVYAADLEEADEIGSDLIRGGYVSMTAGRAARWDHQGDGPWKYERTTLAEPELAQFPFSPARFVDQLAQERMALIGLAIADYQRVHKERPKFLQALLPTYFRRLPIDPWTGGDFLYERDGLPHDMTFTNGRIEPHVPFLASAGITDCRFVRRLTTANTTPSFEVVSRFAPVSKNGRRRSAELFDGPMLRLP